MRRRFTVTWSQALLDDYTDVWVASSSEQRRRLTAIAERIDRELSTAPDCLGREMTSDTTFRVWNVPGIDPPAVVEYKVSLDDLIVTVLRMTLASN